MTVLSAGDLGVEIDYGAGNPSGTLQRLDNGDWEDYRVDGEPLIYSFKVNKLPPGEYRLRSE